jgi:hypothetical protein
MEVGMKPDPSLPAAQITSTLKASSIVGVLGACVLGVLVNVVVARTYKRWDWTSSSLYTLSGPTKQTLHDLKEPVEINVLLPNGNPLTQTARFMLDAYRGETTQLKVRYLDSDKDPAAFTAFQQKYGLLSGKTEDGKIVSESSIVVVKGEKRWFLTTSDLVDVTESSDGRSRSRMEQGLTTAIRNVLSDKKSKVCFAEGHGELGANDPSARGLAELKRRLERNNYRIDIIDAAANKQAAKPWAACDLVMVVGPQSPWSDTEATILADFVKSGGNLLLFLNPILDSVKKRVSLTGLEEIAKLGGIELHNDFIFEKDPKFRVPEGNGEIFLAQGKNHPITEAIVGNNAGSSKMLFILSQSLAPAANSTVKPSVLLTTSEQAFGMTDFFSWTNDAVAPDYRPGDHKGPLTIAMASELPKLPNGNSSHGPRMVIVGSASMAQSQSWQQPALLAGAFFVESSVSWLTSKPPIVDIPEKSSMAAGLRLTEDTYSKVGYYVSLYIPAAAALIGLSVWLRRRSTEKRGKERALSEEDGEENDPENKKDSEKKTPSKTEPDSKQSPRKKTGKKKALPAKEKAKDSDKGNDDEQS